MTKTDSAGRQEQFLDKLRQIVLDNLSNEQFGVEELAKAYGISRSQLHRKLKKLRRQSISQFIREIRLDEALKLLQQDAGTVSEIAYKVGFSSPTYFNTTFRNYLGYPPGEVKLRQNSPGPPLNINASKKRSNKKNLIVALFGIIILVLAWMFFTDRGNVKSTDTISEVEIEKSIAVLPFKNWSGDPNLEYVSDGMTDAVITRLTKIGNIDRVTPFSSVLRYKNTDKLIHEIADEVNVEYILEGNFKLSGEAVQSNLNLIEVKTGKHLWSMEYNGFWKIDQIFEMQAEVAESIAEYMQADVDDSERALLHRKLTKSEEAYRLYLQAEYQYNTLGSEGLENSIRLYEQSIEFDSTFVEPLIGLSNVYTLSGLVWGIMPQDEAWEKTQEYLQKANEKDKFNENKSFLELLSRHGKFYYELDIAAVEKGYLNSDTTQLIFGRNHSEYDFLRKSGRFKSAVNLLNYRMDQDPTWMFGEWNLAIIYFLQGEKETAIDLFSKSDPLLRNNHFYLQESAKWYYYMGQYISSKRNTELMLALSQERRPITYWLSAIHAQMDGNEIAVDTCLAGLNDHYVKVASGSPAWFTAMYYMHTKDVEKAFYWLEKSYERGEVELTWLKEEPMLKTVMDDPRYINLYNNLGFNAVEEITQNLPSPK